MKIQEKKSWELRKWSFLIPTYSIRNLGPFFPPFTRISVYGSFPGKLKTLKRRRECSNQYTESNVKIMFLNYPLIFFLVDWKINKYNATHGQKKNTISLNVDIIHFRNESQKRGPNPFMGT